jgi:hypothetical protein
MAMPAIEQQLGDQQTLAGRPQASVAKALCQYRVAIRVTVIQDHFNHLAKKHACLAICCQ